MSYRVGIERRFWFTRWISVVSHKWENFRWEFKLENGDEYSIAGFQAAGVLVDHASFTRHLQAERQKIEAELAAARLEQQRRQDEADLALLREMKARQGASGQEVPRETPRAVESGGLVQKNPTQTPPTRVDPADPRYTDRYESERNIDPNFAPVDLNAAEEPGEVRHVPPALAAKVQQRMAQLNLS